MTASTASTTRLMVCVKITGYEVSLERRRLYSALADPAAKKHGLVRVVDESGEDYLYVESCFFPVTLLPATTPTLDSGQTWEIGRAHV